MDIAKRVGKALKLRAKGAETRHVVSFGIGVARAMYANACDQDSAHVLRCVEALLGFYLTFGVEPYPADVVQKACLQVADAYVWLRQEAVGSGTHAWAMKPKLQMFMEWRVFQAQEM